MITTNAKSQLEWLATLNPLDHDMNNKFLRKTSIIATIGPKTNSVESMAALRKAGMNIVRINCSHGSHEYFKSVVDNAHKVVAGEPVSYAHPPPSSSSSSAADQNGAQEDEGQRAAKRIKLRDDPQGRPLAIALDTKGPEMRTGMIVDGKDIPVKIGHEFYVTTDDKYAQASDDKHLYVDYKNLPKKVEPGRVIYVDDGILSLEVLAVESDTMVRVRCANNGVLSSKKGVNLPLTDVDLPAISEKDRQDLLFGVEQNVDVIFASFIRRGDDVRTIRSILGEKGAHIRIISKIENHQGVYNFDEILKESDGIMVARGDLGIEIPASQVFMAQKMMIAKCNIAGKPVICATQMLESMIHNNRPTRAEVSDVANAVLDGADCVMLSGETAKGAYPTEAVTMMAETAYLAEQSIAYTANYNELRSLAPVPTETTETIAMAAVSASLEQNAGAILLMSTSGNTARMVSKYRPSCPILVVTRNRAVARVTHLHRGCYPLFYNEPRPDNNEGWQTDVDNRIRFGLAEALKLGIVKKGATVVAVQGWKGGLGHTNTLRILSVPTAENDFALRPT